MESRRDKSDSLAWTVPGLALTAEAFLLTIALAPDTTMPARMAAALAGIAPLAAALHFFWKQSFHFDWFEAVIERERRALDWAPMRRDEYTRAEDWLDYVTGSRFVTRYTKPVSRGDPNSARKTNWRFWIVDRQATLVWTVALGLLFAIDAAIFFYALGAWRGWWGGGLLESKRAG
jgi:hypothetical protein